MDISFLIRGLIFGLSIAAVVGPMSVLCMQRTVNRGLLYGLVSGMGIATADGIYGSMAGFGLTVIISLLFSLQLWIHLLGGLFLIYLGIRTILTKPAERAAAAKANAGSLLGAYVSTLLLTLTNPLTILSFAAIFAGLGAATSGGGYGTAAALVLGVFIGSAVWWVLLTGLVGALRTRVTTGVLRWVNRISGAVILGFGLFALISLR